MAGAGSARRPGARLHTLARALDFALKWWKATGGSGAQSSAD